MKGWIQLHTLNKSEQQIEFEKLEIEIKKEDAIWVLNDIQICNIGSIYHDLDGETVISLHGESVIVKESREKIFELIKKALD